MANPQFGKLAGDVLMVVNLSLRNSSFPLSFIFAAYLTFFSIFCLDYLLEVITVTIEIIFLG
jgi:hypothetical protein